MNVRHRNALCGNTNRFLGHGKGLSLFLVLSVVGLLGWTTSRLIAAEPLAIGQFQVVASVNGLRTFSGVVTGGDGSATVTFSGIPSVAGKSATESEGTFTLTVQVPVGQGGIVTAVAKDGSMTSNPAYCYVLPN